MEGVSFGAGGGVGGGGQIGQRLKRKERIYKVDRLKTDTEGECSFSSYLFGSDIYNRVL